MNAFNLGIEKIIFLFFFFSVSGWTGETIMESIVRKRFVSKGFFRGPYVPVHGIGAFVVYVLCGPIKAYPVLVFLVSAAACTMVEYGAALVLEKIFGARGWDYETYPFTRWCHYKKRVALTTSLFFGLVALCVIYFYWDLGMMIAAMLGLRQMVIADTVFCLVFLTDAVFTGTKCIKNKLEGIPNKTAGLE